MTDPLLDFTPEELEAVRAVLLRYANGLVKQTKQLSLQGTHVFPAAESDTRAPLAAEIDLIDDTRANVQVLLDLLNYMAQPHERKEYMYEFEYCRDRGLEVHLPQSLHDKYDEIYKLVWFVFDDEDEDEDDEDFHEHDEKVRELTS